MSTPEYHPNFQKVLAVTPDDCFNSRKKSPSTAKAGQANE